MAILMILKNFVVWYSVLFSVAFLSCVYFKLPWQFFGDKTRHEFYGFVGTYFFLATVCVEMWKVTQKISDSLLARVFLFICPGLLIGVIAVFVWCLVFIFFEYLSMDWMYYGIAKNIMQFLGGMLLALWRTKVHTSSSSSVHTVQAKSDFHLIFPKRKKFTVHFN